MKRKAVAKKAKSKTLLSAEDLCWHCPPVQPSKRPPRLATILGQERPLAALRTGLSLYGPGYNVYLSGTIGSGRTRLVGDLLEKLKPKGRKVPDRVFVTNFREPNRPRLLTLPRGKAPQFCRDMNDLLLALRESLRSALRSRTHRVSRDLILRTLEEREKRLMAALDRQARKDGCTVVQFPGPNGGMMADIYPVFEEEAINPEVFRDLVAQGKVSRQQQERTQQRRDQLMDRLDEVTIRLAKINQEAERELQGMDHQVVRHVFRAHDRRFRRRWPQKAVELFMQGLAAHVFQDLERWVEPHEAAPVATDAMAEDEPHAEAGPPPVHRHDPEASLGVEVHVVKTSNGEECPIVIESHPTYANLFGTIEAGQHGHIPSLSRAHPGSMIRADGGYLVLKVSELMSEPGVWMHLKRALRVGKVEVREFDPGSGVTSGSLQPQAIPIELKVILIGELGSYEILSEDPQFQQTFKIHAEFDTSIPNNQMNRRRYADLLLRFCDYENLRRFDAKANAAVVELGARRSGRRDRLTTFYGELADIARESSYLAMQNGRDLVTAEDVKAAQEQRLSRSDLHREMVEREFRSGYLLLKTTGKVVGQVNALTVVDSESLMFGKPSRITAATGAGSRHNAHLLNIEREAELSGSLHDKGVLILQGYLLRQFARKSPIYLQASLCFEQTYGGVDGDSATTGELVALLSSLTGIPVRQYLGITGSMNQDGVIQAVSGVNEKVEGFFRLCNSRGLTGDQGVILPKANVPDLMLSPEVCEAVAKGRFHIHVVDHLHKVLELMTGVPSKEILAKAVDVLAVYAANA